MGKTKIMKEFFELLNEYPWTALITVIFIITVLRIVFNNESKDE